VTPAREIAARYDQNAERYDDVTRFNRDAATRLVASLPDRPYGTVLDVGCGTGSAAMAMIERFHVHTVTGVDVSAQMLAQMRTKLDAHPDVQADLHVADVLAMPVADAAYDCVLAGMALHWFRDRAAAIGAMGRALAPGGVLGLVAPGPGHDFEYTEVLRSVTPSVPPAVIDIFSIAQVFPDEVEDMLLGAGLTPLDVWVERRIRRVPPERYMARITAVGSHVWSSIMAPDEADAMVERITAAVARAAGPRGFEYTFTKTYAVAVRQSGAT
jgi:ubiquinone/menaquinone biosynthesis C-methylase UbiE